VASGKRYVQKDNLLEKKIMIDNIDCLVVLLFIALVVWLVVLLVAALVVIV
jgi:hypothetical protein